MGYMFGKEEKLQCIVDVPLKGPNDAALCVAHKTTMYAVFAPAYFHDDGYVLALKGGNDYYPMPEGPELSALQATGSLPNPLPPYQIPLFDYAFGYLLWGALAAGLALQYVSERFKARRHASLQSNMPPSTGQPELRTKTDRWLGQEVAKLLQPGELVQQQAYGLDREETSTLGAASIRALYLALTDRRLLVIHARVGAFGPLRENRGVAEHARTDIVQVTALERHVRFSFRDGKVLDFFAEWGERHLSNQRRFLRDVPRLLGVQAPAAGVQLAPG